MTQRLVLLSLAVMVSGCTSLGVHTGETREAITEREQKNKFCEYAYDNGMILGGAVVWRKADALGECEKETWIWN